MIITTTEELRLFFPGHAIDHIDPFVGFIDNAEHEFLLQPLGQQLYDKLCEYYAKGAWRNSRVETQQTGYYNRLLLMAQRCVAFDAMGRAVGVHAISINNAGMNFASAEDYQKADDQAITRFRDTCTKEAHAALNRLLYTLEQWTKEATVPDGSPSENNPTAPTVPAASPAVQTVPAASPSGSPEQTEITQLWRSSRYFYLCAQLLIPSAVVMQDYLNIYDSREKFIQLLPDLHFIQEEIIAPAIGEEFCDYLVEEQMKNEADIPPVIRRLLHKLRKIMTCLLEGRTTVLHVDKQRKITAHDEGIRLLGQLQGFCEQRQDAILATLGTDKADIYTSSPMYIKPVATVPDDSPSGKCNCHTTDLNGHGMSLLVTEPLL